MPTSRTSVSIGTRLCCQACGSASDWVRLADGFKGQGQEVHEVMLVQDRP